MSYKDMAIRLKEFHTAQGWYCYTDITLCITLLADAW